MRKKRPNSAGFSLIEAIIAVCITGLFVGGGYVFVGRKIVDESDPVKAAKAAGFGWAKVIDRKNFSSPFSSCGHDFVTFTLLAARPGSSVETITVCCPAWYGACEIAQ